MSTCTLGIWDDKICDEYAHNNDSSHEEYGHPRVISKCSGVTSILIILRNCELLKDYVPKWNFQLINLFQSTLEKIHLVKLIPGEEPIVYLWILWSPCTDICFLVDRNKLSQGVPRSIPNPTTET